MQVLSQQLAALIHRFVRVHPFENGNGWKKLIKPIQNNKQEKFLMGVKVPKDAPSGTYIYDLNITYMDGAAYIAYDNHIWKIYVNVP